MREYFKKLIPLRVRNKLRYLLPSFIFRKVSYSQSGEDVLIIFLLDMICGNRPKKYLDVGANHPFSLSNTALLYKTGSSGVLVEPDPFFADLLRRKRPRDEVLELGVHFSGEKTAEFYILDSPTLNTFSKNEMERYVKMGQELDKTIIVNLININEILNQIGKLDFLNLDIEGLDFQILKMVDWEKYRPKTICVETINYENKLEPKKQTEIIKFMEEQDYSVYSDTFINTIFVDNHVWHEHWSEEVKSA